uniref:Macaca fascicularis brain cDNA clone: QbsB-10668, similar to human HIV-1 Tat interactive protein 2, 30kDa (HTATIP2), mRNA, RefSeq: NM_006410.3 n=1 Tax=Macaca fascicularis TaxID=9541 RepID=I7G4T7_MACFA|nr:unnamed protein product [Macaca fascicularis]
MPLVLMPLVGGPALKCLSAESQQPGKPCDHANELCSKIVDIHVSELQKC